MNIMDILYVPFGYVMKGCLWISQNRFWIAIIFFSLIMEAVLLPLSIKQQKASVKQQKLKPMEIAIRRKYKGQNDKVTQQKCNMEIQEMYQKNGYNAFAGCLPLLIQFPIIIALYAIVRNPMQYTLFMNDADIDVMYADSIVLCEQVKDGLEEDLAALAVTDGEPESETSSSGAAAYTGTPQRNAQSNMTPRACATGMPVVMFLLKKSSSMEIASGSQERISSSRSE